MFENGDTVSLSLRVAPTVMAPLADGGLVVHASPPMPLPAATTGTIPAWKAEQNAAPVCLPVAATICQSHVTTACNMLQSGAAS